MQLIPIKQTLEENAELVNNPLCGDALYMTIEFYKKIGFVPPWIGYFVKQDGELVGSAGFKGRPVNGTIEIAYGTNEQYRKQGIGTAICRLMVDLSLQTDPSVKITARTLPENNFSNRVLEKNNFVCLGIVNDPEDSDVWEWIYTGNEEYWPKG